MEMARSLGRHRARCVGIGAAALALGLASSVVVVPAHALGPPPVIPGLTARASADTGFSVSSPESTTNQTLVGQNAAVHAIPTLPPGSRVLHVALASVTDTHRDPTFQCLCYVVSVTPTGLPAGDLSGYTGPPPAPPAFLVNLVDATSGKWVGEVGGS